MVCFKISMFRAKKSQHPVWKNLMFPHIKHIDSVYAHNQIQRNKQTHAVGRIEMYNASL